MKKAILFFAPHETQLLETIRKVKSFGEKKYIPAFNDLCELVEASFEYSTLPFSMWEEFKSGIRELLNKESVTEQDILKDLAVIPYDACWQLILSIFCSLYYMLIRYEIPHIWHAKHPPQVFYAGSGFGEYWVIAHQLYLEGMPLWDTIFYAAYRSNTYSRYYMSSLTALKSLEATFKSNDFSRIIIPTEKVREFKRKFTKLKNLYGFEHFGEFISQNGTLYVFGKTEELQVIADKCNLSISSSYPLHTEYLFNIANTFAANFLYKTLNPSVIPEIKSNSVAEILSHGIYSSLDERELLGKVYKKIQLKGIDVSEIKWIYL